MVQSGRSISVDDHYLYILGANGIMRIDKSTGATAGQLTTTGWSGGGSVPTPTGTPVAPPATPPATTGGATGSTHRP